MSVANHMERISDEHLAELERQHGRIKHVVYNGVDIVFRKPKKHECQLHAAALENPQQKPGADEELAKWLVVQVGAAKDREAKTALASLIEEYPYMVRNEAIGGALARLTGVVQDEHAKTYGDALKNSDTSPSSSQRA